MPCLRWRLAPFGLSPAPRWFVSWALPLGPSADHGPFRVLRRPRASGGPIRCFVVMTKVKRFRGIMSNYPRGSDLGKQRNFKILYSEKAPELDIQGPRS